MTIVVTRDSGKKITGIECRGHFQDVETCVAVTTTLNILKNALENFLDVANYKIEVDKANIKQSISWDTLSARNKDVSAIAELILSELKSIALSAAFSTVYIKERSIDGR